MFRPGEKVWVILLFFETFKQEPDYRLFSATVEWEDRSKNQVQVCCSGSFGNLLMSSSEVFRSHSEAMKALERLKMVNES